VEAQILIVCYARAVGTGKRAVLQPACGEEASTSCCGAQSFQQGRVSFLPRVPVGNFRGLICRSGAAVQIISPPLIHRPQLPCTSPELPSQMSGAALRNHLHFLPSASCYINIQHPKATTDIFDAWCWKEPILLFTFCTKIVFISKVH
jgi:hypothetical protein